MSVPETQAIREELEAPRRAALSPYRVLDLTSEIGQYAGRALAEMGADVIKVEPPGGDPVRRIGPFVRDEPGPDRSLLWFVLNASKRGITLDLDGEAGRDLFRRLVAQTDLVLESYPPGYLKERGIDYDDLRAQHPKLVWVSVTGFGRDGPYSDYRWSDLVGLALGGLLYLWGEPDRPPTRARSSHGYFHASMGAALGAALGLYHARRTGRGQLIDVSMQEVLTFVLAGPGGVSGYWSLQGINITRSGDGINLGHMVSRTIYPCKDGHVAVSTLFGPHLPKLIGLMKAEGAAGFLEDEKWLTATRFQPMPGQWQCTQQEADAAEALLETWLLTHTRDEVMRLALENELMIFPVLTAAENLENEQLKARDYFQHIEHRELGMSIAYPGAPVKLSATPWRIKGRAPLLGEHNADVYDALGVTQDELAKFSSAGTI